MTNLGDDDNGNDHLMISTPACQLEVLVEEAGWQGHFPDGTLGQSLETLLKAMAKQFEGPLGLANVLLADDAHVQTLNATFRGKDKPTNVLSFPAGAPDESFLGDIIVALQTVENEAKTQSKPFCEHFLHLVLHGLLHLLGYDHTNDTEAEEMESLERDVLQALGIPDPYDDDTFELG